TRASSRAATCGCTSPAASASTAIRSASASRPRSPSSSCARSAPTASRERAPRRRCSDRSAQEEATGGIAGLLAVAQAEAVQARDQLAGLARRRVQPEEDAAESGAVIAIVEQRDVTARAEVAEELEQRSRTLRELEGVEHLVAHVRGPAAHHVADMRLGEIVLAEVQACVAQAAQVLRDRRRLVLAGDLEADEDVRFVARSEAVVELG